MLHLGTSQPHCHCVGSLECMEQFQYKGWSGRKVGRSQNNGGSPGWCVEGGIVPWRKTPNLTDPQTRGTQGYPACFCTSNAAVIQRWPRPRGLDASLWPGRVWSRTLKHQAMGRAVQANTWLAYKSIPLKMSSGNTVIPSSFFFKTLKWDSHN